MNADEQIRKLQETKAKLDNVSPSARSQELHKVRQEAADSIQDHLVDLILHKRDEEKRKKTEKHTAIAYTLLAAIVLMSFAAGMFYSTQDSGITGFVTSEINSIQLDETYTAYTEKLIERDDITSVKITGSVESGSARVYLQTTNGRLLVANVTEAEQASDYVLQTNKQEYALGETVSASVTPTAGASLYIYSGDEESTIIAGASGEFTPEAEGTYTAVALITTSQDIVRLELNFTVLQNSSSTINTTNQIRHSTESRPSHFEAICDETCAMEPNSRPLLIIEPSQGGSIEINEILINTLQTNRPPAQAITIPTIIIQRGRAKAIGLNSYFIDPDGDEILFEISGIDNVDSTINGNELVLRSVTLGNYPARLYATDGMEVTTSNDFYVQVIEASEQIPDDVNEPDTIIGEEPETFPTETGEPIITEQPSLPEVLTPADVCEGPIGERPSYCFDGNEEKFFREVESVITDRSDVTVGRFTRFGNFIIRGVLIENSSGEPESNDFKIGYTDLVDFEDFSQNTAWVDSEGNLHIRGTLYQEVPVLEPGQFNTYIIKNKIGIILAYFDERTGDLYLRGNLVQLGKI